MRKRSHRLPGRYGYLVAWSGMAWSWSWSWSWSWQGWAVQTLKKKRKPSSINWWYTTHLTLKKQHYCSKTVSFAKTVPLCARKINTHCIMPKTVAQEDYGILFVLSTMFLLDAETRMMRPTPGCYRTEEPGFDFTPVFTAIQISFKRLPWLPFLQCLIDSTS